jgi:hypothetical protein
MLCRHGSMESVQIATELLKFVVQRWIEASLALGSGRFTAMENRSESLASGSGRFTALERDAFNQ